MKTYIYVPFAKNSEAKSLGAKWNDKRQWYAPNNEPKLLEKFGINSNPVNLIGEDRLYGGNNLFVDLIPRSCWFSNVRKYTHRSDWDRLRNHVYQRVNNVCECCGSNIQLEAHERWDYNNETKIQKLMRLVALCHQCHQSTHMGYARVTGNDEEAEFHLQKVRDFTQDETHAHIDAAFDLYEKRNKIKWELDLTLLTNGIKLAQND